MKPYVKDKEVGKGKFTYRDNHSHTESEKDKIRAANRSLKKSLRQKVKLDLKRYIR